MQIFFINSWRAHQIDRLFEQVLVEFAFLKDLFGQSLSIFIVGAPLGGYSGVRLTADYSLEKLTVLLTLPIQFEDGDFYSFLNESEILVKESILHLLVYAFKIDYENIPEGLTFFRGGDVSIVPEDDLVNHKLQSEVAEDSLVTGYFHKSFHGGTTLMKVISADIWDVFEEREEFS